jgi:putative tricarboxylic transport membrane protein
LSPRGAQVAAAAVLLALAAVVAVESLKLAYYTALGPGPGFFPFWLAIALGAASLAMGARAAAGRGVPAPSGARPSAGGIAKMAAVLIALGAAIVLLEPLGFRLTMLGVYLGLLYALGRRDFVVTPLVALAGSFGVYHVFVHWLKVPLPAGPFGG